MKNCISNQLNTIIPYAIIDNNLGINLDEKVKALVDGKNFGNIATIMSDGSPQVTPVWINRDGDSILVNTAMGRTKQRNSVRDPRVALTIFDQENPYSMAMIRGTVVEQTEEGADDHIDSLAQKYIGEDKYPWRNPAEKRIILRVMPEKIFVM